MVGSLSDSLVAGCVSGATTRFLIAPLDVLKVRFQLQVEPIQANGFSKYQGIRQAIRTVLREEGFRAFWKGTIPGQFHYAVFGAAEFATYEVSSKALNAVVRSESESWKMVVRFSSGCSAGAVATLVSHPFDMIRTRLASQGEPKVYSSIADAMRKLYAEKGVLTFYRGLVPALMSIVPQAGLYFGFYHTFTAAWDTAQLTQSLSVRSLVCGAASGTLSKMLLLPLDLVKRRLEVQGFDEARRPFGRVPHYSGIRECVISIAKEEGILAFYKGTILALTKAGTSVGLFFFLYEEMLRLLRARNEDQQFY